MRALLLRHVTAPKTLIPPPSLLLRHVTRRQLSTAEPDLIPSSAYYDELVEAAGRDGDYAAVRRLLNKRMSEGFFNTSKTFKFIAAAADDGSVLEELTLTLSQLDEGFSRKNAFDSLIACLCKLHRTKDALRVAEEVVRQKFGANTVTFHPILNALTKKKDLEAAWLVVDFMKENKIPLDVTAYNFLLTGYCVIGDLTSAAKLLTKMGEEGLSADTRTYDALVLGACRAGKLDGALVILRRMEDHGVPVLYATHMHIINALLNQGYFAQAMDYVMSFSGKERALDMENFGVLASRLIDMKRFDEAKVIVAEMSRMGLKMVSEKLINFYNLHIKD